MPGTYHLFYADAEGHAGTDLTFFPWPDTGPLRPGHGLAGEVSLAVPPASLPYWEERLRRYGVAVEAAAPRFGEPTLGERLVLPPWLEARRDEIERGLPSLAAPLTVAASRSYPRSSRPPSPRERRTSRDRRRH